MSYYLPQGDATSEEREWTRPFWNEKAAKPAWGALNLHDVERTQTVVSRLNKKLESDAVFGTLEGPTRMWNTPSTSMVLGPYVLYQQGVVAKGIDIPVLPIQPADMRQPVPPARTMPQFTYGAM